LGGGRLGIKRGWEGKLGKLGELGKQCRDVPWHVWELGKLGRQFVGAGLTDNVTQQTNNLTKPALVGEQEEMRKNFSSHQLPITNHQF